MKVCKHCGSKNCVKHRRHCRECGNKYLREWRKINSDKVKGYQKKYYEQDKESRHLHRKQWLESKKDGKWTVYMLPNANDYVGYTSSWYERALNHKSAGNDTTNYRFLMKCDTEEDAKELEALLHDMGYPGKHRHKKTSH